MKKCLKIIGNILTVVAIIYIVKTIYSMKISFADVSNKKALLVALLLGLFIMCLTLYLLAYAWTRVITYFSKKKFEKQRGICIYVKANLGKYMPGNVMHYVERNLFAAEVGLNHIEVAVSSVIEIVGLFFTALVICIILAFDDLKKIIATVHIQKIYIVGAAGIFFLLCVFIFLILRSTKGEKIKNIREQCCNRRFFLLLFSNFLIYAVVFLLLGIAMVFIATIPFHIGVTFENTGRIIASYTLAWVSGFIVPGAPGGIGIREYVFSVLTKGTQFEEIILVAALLHRFINIIGDSIGYIVAVFRMKKDKHFISTPKEEN